MDSCGLTVSKVNGHTEFNQYYVQCQETIKYMQTTYNTRACPVRHSTK